MTKTASLRRDKWREIISQQRASGISAAAFCRENHIAPGIFYGWTHRLANRATDLAPAFIEATSADARSATSKVPNGAEQIGSPQVTLTG